MIAYLGVLVAAEIVLSRFLSINAWNIKIGFNFVPIVIAAMLFGPLPAAAVAAMGDFLGAVLFPIGPYFPGFTLTAFCTGLVFGLFLHEKRTPGRVLAAVAINQLVFSLLLNSLWISILYGSPFLPLLSTRIIQCAVLAPVQFVMIVAINRVLSQTRLMSIMA
ncbi:MAG: folate family ECF transporter S component [Lachnospiraceae bacterium]|nr:folate family ECF transporter S component [Lachnospiraceae bacterium]